MKSILTLLQEYDLDVPIRDVDPNGKIFYRQPLLKISSAPSIKLPFFKRLMLSLVRKLVPEWFVACAQSVEILITDDLYFYVKFLKEHCGYSFLQAVTIASSTCPECLDLILDELGKMPSFSPPFKTFLPESVQCPVCALVDFVYVNVPKVKSK